MFGPLLEIYVLSDLPQISWKTEIGLFPVFTWKLEFVQNILWILLSGNRIINNILFKLFETIIDGFHKDCPTTDIMLEKPLNKFGSMVFSMSKKTVDPNEKLMRWIDKFLYQTKVLISIKNQKIEAITPIHDVPQVVSLHYSP